jgi:hypothetical protein
MSVQLSISHCALKPLYQAKTPACGIIQQDGIGEG